MKDSLKNEMTAKYEDTHTCKLVCGMAKYYQQNRNVLHKQSLNKKEKKLFQNILQVWNCID